MLKENVVDMTDPVMFKDTMSIWPVQGKQHNTKHANMTH